MAHALTIGVFDLHVIFPSHGLEFTLSGFQTGQTGEGVVRDDELEVLAAGGKHAL